MDLNKDTATELLTRKMQGKRRSGFIIDMAPDPQDAFLIYVAFMITVQNCGFIIEDNYSDYEEKVYRVVVKRDKISSET